MFRLRLKEGNALKKMWKRETVLLLFLYSFAREIFTHIFEI